MTSVLVLMGGIINQIDEIWWGKFLAESGLQVNFAFSTWYEHPLVVSQPILSRTVLRDQEYQQLVELMYKDIAAQFICTAPENIPMNSLKMWHKWARYSSLLKLTDYDVIVKTRGDLDIDLESIPLLIDVIHSVRAENSPGLAIPSGGDWRYGINDVVAVGRPDCISYYLSIIRNISDYYEKTNFFHAEWLLRYHLFDMGGFKVRRFPFPIRIRGKLHNGECQRAYLDNCPLRAGLLREFYEERKRGGNLRSALRRHSANHRNPKTNLVEVLRKLLRHPLVVTAFRKTKKTRFPT